MKLLDDLRAYHYYVLGMAHYRGLFKSANPVMAAGYFTKSASLGLPAAQNLIGLMCLEGHGVPRHYREAFRWFRESAEHNDPEGHCYLGLLYAQGTGAPQSWQSAEEHWLLAAAGGNADSMYFLGLLHHAGIERPVSSVEAAKWFEKSAAAGYAPAAHALALMHRSKEHPGASIEEELKWLNLAAQKNYAPSLLTLAGIYEAPGPHHNAELAADCYKRAAMSGDADAMFRISMMYLEQKGTAEAGPFNDFLALGWLRQAMEENHPGAAYVLGYLYEGGEGVFFEPDGRQIALECFKKAAMLGDSRAETKLKWLLQSEPHETAKKEPLTLTPQTVRPSTLKWMQKSREQRELEQLYDSAKRFYLSEQGKRDLARAIEYFRLCSAAGSAEADYMLGHMYEHGEGVSADICQAKKWYELAADRGSEAAKDHLKELANLKPD